MKTRIHVNQHNIKFNRRERVHEHAVGVLPAKPVITCKTYKDNRYGNEAIIHGPSRVVYRPEKPLPCGAVLWIETDSKVEVLL